MFRIPHFVIGSALALAACGRAGTAPSDGTICTALFAMQAVYVRDAAGAAVTDAQVTTTLVRTGAQIPVNSLALMAPANYIILDDGATQVINHSGDQVRVTGHSAKGTFTADYVFDVPGGCHIRKLSGPDTLVAR